MHLLSVDEQIQQLTVRGTHAVAGGTPSQMQFEFKWAFKSLHFRPDSGGVLTVEPAPEATSQWRSAA